MAITANPRVQNGALITAQGTQTFLNITSATVIKTTAGRVAKVSVIVQQIYLIEKGSRVGSSEV